ncbi:MAG: hypothetical protein ACXV4C_06460 [Halobacteriota archaeon]
MPPEYEDIIGTVADIIETEHDGRRAFLIVPNNNSTVLKPSTGVLKPKVDFDAKSRLSGLESKVNETKSSPLLKESDSLHENAKNNGLGEIRTLGPRRVKAENSEHASAFSSCFEGFVCGATTTRKARAPS